jgi:hypothetical protein
LLNLQHVTGFRRETVCRRPIINNASIRCAFVDAGLIEELRQLPMSTRFWSESPVNTPAGHGIDPRGQARQSASLSSFDSDYFQDIHRTYGSDLRIQFIDKRFNELNTRVLFELIEHCTKPKMLFRVTLK